MSNTLSVPKVQSVLRNAIRQYNIVSDLDDETLVAFLAVDIVRNEVMPQTQSTPAPQRPSRARTTTPQQPAQPKPADGPTPAAQAKLAQLAALGVTNPPVQAQEEPKVAVN